MMRKTAKPVANKPARKSKEARGSRLEVREKKLKKIKKTSRTPNPQPRTPKRPAGIPEKMRDAALKVLDERQADDIVTIDLTGRSSMADYIIVASGRASRQIGAIAHYLREAFVGLGASHPRVEGEREGNWVLVDCGDVIVHLFRPEVRAYYRLEDMWSRKKA